MRIACISDIHIGAIPHNILKVELREQFLDKIKERNIDLVVICGDLVDHKLSFNSEDSKLVMEFMEELTSLYPVRLIRGTKTHDMNQLNNFIYLENKEGIDFKLFNVMSKEEYQDLNILYMPEEYLENYFDDYEELLSESYDVAFFHGTWNFAGYVSKMQESERPIKQAPLYKYDEMKDVATQFIGGHIHITEKYNNVMYTGSFSRWCHGEQKPKGFVIYDTDTKKTEFVENELARKYITLDVNKLMLEEADIKDKIKVIEQYKNNKDIHKLRIKFDDTGNDLDTLVLKEYFSDNKSVNVSINNTKRIEKAEEENKLTDEYAFIFNKEYDMATTISMYLDKHDNIKMTAESINELLLEDE